MKAKPTKEWLSQFKAGRKLIQRKAKKPNTLKTYIYGIKYLCEWIEKTPDQIVEEYRTDVKTNMYGGFEKWEQTFEDFSDYLEQRFKGTTPATYFAAAKELINVNVPRSLKLKAEGPEAKPRIIKPISKEDLIKIDNGCDERERTFIRFLKDNGISRADAVLLNYGDIKKFETEEYVKIDVYRSKENVEYETWIGPDTVEMLKIWFNIRRRRGEQITDKTPISADYHGKRLTANALSIIIDRIKQRLGITISTHRLRKFFETYAAVEVRHPIVLKYWMGHKVRKSRDVEARYIIPPEIEQRKMYMRAYKNLTLQPRADEFELLIADAKARMVGMSPEQKKRFVEALAFRHKAIANHPEIKELLEGGPAEGGLPAEPKFKEINESELIAHLNSGWRITHNLQNGRLIVERR